MEHWKYRIGDFVNPVVMSGNEHPTKMVITARVTAEYAQHVERHYICSHYRLGEYLRTNNLESELVPAKQNDAT